MSEQADEGAARRPGADRELGPQSPAQGSRRGLGRGLGALLVRPEGELLHVDVDRIVPNPSQPRYVVDEVALAELADSVRLHGILQPLIVTRGDRGGGGPDGSGGGTDEADDPSAPTYALVAGERRWRAAREAGLRTVPVIVKETTASQRLELALVENLQRQDLNPLEAAQAYRQLVEEHGLTQEAVAERVGKNRATVANTLRLLHLPPEARDALARGAISEGHARAILACSAPTDRETLLGAIVGQGLSVRQAEDLARRLNAGTAQPRPDSGPLAPEVALLEDRFRRLLGAEVRLYRGRRGGRLVVRFGSDDELQQLYDAIRGTPPHGSDDPGVSN